MLPDELTGHYAVGLSYDPQDLRFGYTDGPQYFLERRRNRTILQGKARLFELYNDYARSYVDQTFSVLHYRDMLMALALNMTLRCVQTRDVAYTELTNHSDRFWRRHGREFWPSIPNYEDQPDYTPDAGFYGVAGSLAFWMYAHEDSGQGLDALQLLQRMLQYFWQDLGIDPTLSPCLKQATLFDQLQLDTIPFLAYETALTRLNSAAIADQPEGAQPILASLRQNFLNGNDWNNLKQRLLMGEYFDPLLDVINRLQSWCNADETARAYYQLPVTDPNALTTFVEATLQIARPAGLPLVYQAFAVEGLAAAIEYLSALPETISSLNFGEFLRLDTQADQRLELARRLCTTYDACGALALFNTLLEGKGLAYRFFLTALQVIRHNPEPYISTECSTRLTEFAYACTVKGGCACSIP